ncbi:hypothetical protein HELRODRAFT_63876 [Helobdella robusta]|uniref:Cyclin-dependent kinase 5 activator n=1 Tax=Helobdella robusta TaxID=6412 RepID=T1FXL5_HELRO|nr:hypothetical protein HELRODRAFT_63876 [Helobdella robusta]ESO06128.1 hypothetical protein HELRODRAFT_63876 [Helobdella robusta]
MKTSPIYVSVFYQNENSLNITTNIYSRKRIMHATTPELLLCLGGFFKKRCSHLKEFDSSKTLSWLKYVDRSLLSQGWQDVAFINPANIIFIYFLVSSELETPLMDEIIDVNNLQALVLTCFYLAYTYMGNEISYPSKPFLVNHEASQHFWDRCLRIINTRSSDMLKINRDPTFFANVFLELKSYLPS